MKNLKKSCFICRANECNGIILNGERICKVCEDKIVNTNIIHSEYDVFKEKVKIILFN